MITLFLAIACSCLIFLLFKLFPHFGIDTFQAIVVNYFVAFTSGWIFYGHEWNQNNWSSGNWPWFCLLTGVLLISLFVVMGRSAQQNGMAMTSVAVKMSMAISVVLMIVFYSEHLGWFKLFGILSAILGVVLVSKPGQERQVGSGNKWWMLIVLFLGSGLLDFLLNYVQHTQLGTLTPALFSALSFLVAGLIGMCLFFSPIVKDRQPLHLKHFLAGVILGIPNFFSIFFLIKAYSDIAWENSTVLTTINLSIVLVTSLIGFLAFKEKLTWTKLIGLSLALVAIFLLVQ
jgi:drug/metabolite transporter (DMT)-like permease